ncbi:hypothetical protein NMG60_11018411 [Bertholletia excelsa]
MMKTRVHFVKSQVAFVLLVVSGCCLLVVIISVTKLPEVSVGDITMTSFGPKRIKKIPGDGKIGQFGKMVIEMLPDDLAFTVFLPSEHAFERDLKLKTNDSLVGEKFDDTHAILTRVLGFSVVPRAISSVSVQIGRGINYDSLAGFSLYISKDSDGMLIVNRVRSEHVDIQQGKIVVHVMDGVIMDAEFEQSVQPDNDEED